MNKLKTLKITLIIIYCYSIISCTDDSQGVLLKEITVEPTNMSMEVGTTRRIAAIPTPYDYDVSGFNWTTSDASVATVNQSGVVSAIEVGTAQITVSAGTVTKTIFVTVTGKALQYFTVSPEKLSLKSNETAALTVKVSPEDITVTPTWQSEDETIVTVSDNGAVRAVSDGFTYIIITVENTVKKVPVSVNALTPNGSDIKAIGSGSSFSFAFDLNLETAYKLEGDYQWVGLDLGAKHVITKLSYCPRQSSADLMLLGVFEGANEPDFSDAVPLDIISNIPAQQTVTTAAINVSRGFRYVRYVGPNIYNGVGNATIRSNCTVAELLFYGYPGEGDDSQLAQIAGIPSVVIHTVNNAEVTSKEVYIKGMASFIYNDGKSFYFDTIDIRGRGNASWNLTDANNLKKPYRIKLLKSARLMDFPAKARNWTLINNWGDKTLMRNLLAFDVSRMLEMPYTPAGQPVNVFFNGEYKGCYQLCDHIDVRKGRVNIKEMDENDVEGDALTGGYLFEIDGYASQEPANTWFYSSKGTPITIKSPDIVYNSGITRLEQLNYIREHFKKMETALYSSNFKDPINGYRKYLDVATFVRHFLVNELCGNGDAYWSVNMYKQRSDDIIYTGPVWDFDLGFENDNRINPYYNINDWMYKRTGPAAGMISFVNRLFDDPAFQSEIKNVYTKYRNSGALSMETLNARIDYYANAMAESQRLNFLRWKILSTPVHQNPAVEGSYQGEVQRIRKFVAYQIPWFDNKLEYNK